MKTVLSSIFFFMIFLHFSNSVYAAPKTCLGIVNPFKNEAPSTPYLDPFKAAMNEVSKKTTLTKPYRKTKGAIDNFTKYLGIGNNICEIYKTAADCVDANESFTKSCATKTAEKSLCEISKYLGLSANPLSAIPSISPASAVASVLQYNLDQIIPLSSYNPFCNPENQLGPLQCCLIPLQDDPDKGGLCKTAHSSYDCPRNGFPFIGLAEKISTNGSVCTIYKDCYTKRDKDGKSTNPEDRPGILFLIKYKQIRDKIAELYAKSVKGSGDGDTPLYGSCTYNKFHDLLTGRGCLKAGYEAEKLHSKTGSIDDMLNLATLRLMSSYPKASTLWGSPEGGKLSSSDEFARDSFYDRFVDRCGYDIIYGAIQTTGLPNPLEIAGLVDTPNPSGAKNLCVAANELEFSVKQKPTAFNTKVRTISVVTNATNEQPVGIYIEWKPDNRHAGKNPFILLDGSNSTYTISHDYLTDTIAAKASALVVAIGEGGYIKSTEIDLSGILPEKAGDTSPFKPAKKPGKPAPPLVDKLPGGPVDKGFKGSPPESKTPVVRPSRPLVRTPGNPGKKNFVPKPPKKKDTPLLRANEPKRPSVPKIVLQFFKYCKESKLGYASCRRRYTTLFKRSCVAIRERNLERCINQLPKLVPNKDFGTTRSTPAKTNKERAGNTSKRNFRTLKKYKQSCRAARKNPRACYRRYGKRLLKACKDAGLISQRSCQKYLAQP